MGRSCIRGPSLPRREQWRHSMDQRIPRRAILAGGAVIGAGVIASRVPATGEQRSGGVALRPGSDPISVAFLMDDRSTMIDFAGPWEVFQDAGIADVPGFSLFTVSPTRDQLHTSGGFNFTGQHTYAD